MRIETSTEFDGKTTSYVVQIWEDTTLLAEAGFESKGKSLKAAAQEAMAELERRCKEARAALASLGLL